MSDIRTISFPTGAQVYGLIFNTSGQVWNGSSFGAFSSGSYSTYPVISTEISGTGLYQWTFPSGISTAAIYFVAFRVSTTNGTPAYTDSAQGINQATIYWTGSAEALVSTAPTAAAIATAVWTDTTSSDFTTSGSPGKILNQADANGYLKVDVVDIAGTASVGQAGYMAIDWAHVANPTTTVALSNTTTSSTAPTTSQITTAVWAGAPAQLTQVDGNGYLKVDSSYIGGTSSTGLLSGTGVFAAAALANTPSNAPTEVVGGQSIVVSNS
jgi:hypothetical protein